MDNLIKIILIIIVAFLLLGCSCSCIKKENFGKGRGKQNRNRGKQNRNRGGKGRKNRDRGGMDRRGNINQRTRSYNKKAADHDIIYFKGSKSCGSGEYMDSIRRTCKLLNHKGRNNPGQVLSLSKCKEWCNLKECNTCVSPYGYCGSTSAHCNEMSSCICSN